MGVGCILYRNCISRPTEVGALGGLIFVCFLGIYDVEKQMLPVASERLQESAELS